MSTLRCLPLIAAAALIMGSVSSARGQQECQDTPEGRICKVQQAVGTGALVPEDLQRQLGLVTVNNGCSGTLLNRWWVLTARHCVQVNSQSGAWSALQPADQVSVTAAWTPGRVGVPSRFVELGGANRRDIVLLYLGRADLGSVLTQRLYLQRWDVVERWVGQRLLTTDGVTQYGRGLATFAVGGTNGKPVVLGGGDGPYRSAPFTPSNIGENSYELAMNATNQVGHGGDSGGPTIVTRNGVGVGIAGVQSGCAASGWAPGAPAMNPPWAWATGITYCAYVSVEPIVREIGMAIRETAQCRPQPGCVIAPILDYVIKP